VNEILLKARDLPNSVSVEQPNIGSSTFLAAYRANHGATTAAYSDPGLGFDRTA
jgi:hypothetical protein